MKQETRTALESLGMNLEQTLARFVNKEELLFKFLRRFVDDKSFAQLADAVARGNGEEGFHAAHTLKGVAGNLGLDALFNAVSPLVEVLRSNDQTSAGSLYAVVETQYQTAIQTILSLDPVQP